LLSELSRPTLHRVGGATQRFTGRGDPGRLIVHGGEVAICGTAHPARSTAMNISHAIAQPPHGELTLVGFATQGARSAIKPVSLVPLPGHHVTRSVRPERTQC
jgi:hypothetical protein